MTTDIPNYLTAEQERVINDFQRVARELMGDGVTYFGFSFYDTFEDAVIHAGHQVFIGKFVSNGEQLSNSANDAIHKLRTEIKSPAEQAQIDYDNAMKAMEDAKAKLDALS